VKWFRKSAEQGNEIAQRNLGYKYHNGDGVPKDSAEAVKWFRKSAEQGDSLAQGILGFEFYLGESVPRDLVQAHVWCNIAAANGYELAKEALAAIEKEMPPAQKAEATKLAREIFERIQAKEK